MQTNEPTIQELELKNINLSLELIEARATILQLQHRALVEHRDRMGQPQFVGVEPAPAPTEPETKLEEARSYEEGI